MKCVDCPRFCRADRDCGEIGLCGGGRLARVAKVINEFKYEEPCLGTVTAVFFSGCALKCSYCQNYKISRGGAGEEYDDRRLAALFDGAEHPLDLVTPSHYLSNIERAIDISANAHSFIYNTSGYETVGAVKRAAKFTDVFLTDYKYGDNAVATRLSKAGDYVEVAQKALRVMRDAVPDEWAIENGEKLLKRGLIVRHLVLPECVDNSIKAIDDIARIAGTNTVLSLMSQFTPNGVGEPNARLKKIEYKLVVEHALKLGFNVGYIQDFDSANSAYTPEF
ncbi:MAG: 4Fe-4S cluster-binding domain-containing protein [Clostridiales bacterium]|nr:4Fe-4S cluster-binding domain-containing protein [Clostridiales bacterium]